VWCRKADKDGPFGGVSEEMVNANVPAFDAAKSPSQSGRRGRCERGMALAAAVSPMAAESHGEEFGVHGDAISIFVCARLRDFLIYISTICVMSFEPTGLDIIIIFSYIGYITLLPPTYVPTC